MKIKGITFSSREIEKLSLELLRFLLDKPQATKKELIEIIRSNEK